MTRKNMPMKVLKTAVAFAGVCVVAAAAHPQPAPRDAAAALDEVSTGAPLSYAGAPTRLTLPATSYPVPVRDVWFVAPDGSADANGKEATEPTTHRAGRLCPRQRSRSARLGPAVPVIPAVHRRPLLHDRCR